MGNLIDMRKRYKDDFEKAHGVRLGFMSAFVKASTAALKEIPAVNAVIDDETQEVVYRDYCDVSFAAA
jgi:2-oxoglutarate dehydrogenase E2 component (dihydrolipoamide succinyltransferase)